MVDGKRYYQLKVGTSPAASIDDIIGQINRMAGPIVLDWEEVDDV